MKEHEKLWDKKTSHANHHPDFIPLLSCHIPNIEKTGSIESASSKGRLEVHQLL